MVRQTVRGFESSGKLAASSVHLLIFACRSSLKISVKTRRNIPQEFNLYRHPCENLESNKKVFIAVLYNS